MRVKILAALSGPLLLTSCFTGIEHTPRITLNDVRHAGVTQTAEQRISAEIKGELPSVWHSGKQWLIDDERAARVFTSSQPLDSLKGKTISLERVDRYTSITGEPALEYVFTIEGIQEPLSYRPDVTPSGADTLKSLSIPFTIELSAVEKADSIMRGRRLYVLSALWTDVDGNPTIGKHHIAANVTEVRPGSWLYPLQVVFRTDDSETNHYIYMTYGEARSATRNFDRVFTMTDPRRSYPSITPTRWQQITNSKIELGMTRDECRLALGQPPTIDRGATNEAQLERWTYPDGVYLIFEDGILTRFRQ